MRSGAGAACSRPVSVSPDSAWKGPGSWGLGRGTGGVDGCSRTPRQLGQMEPGLGWDLGSRHTGLGLGDHLPRGKTTGSTAPTLEAHVSLGSWQGRSHGHPGQMGSLCRPCTSLQPSAPAGWGTRSRKQCRPVSHLCQASALPVRTQLLCFPAQHSCLSRNNSGLEHHHEGTRGFPQLVFLCRS